MEKDVFVLMEIFEIILHELDSSRGMGFILCNQYKIGDITYANDSSVCKRLVSSGY